MAMAFPPPVPVPVPPSAAVPVPPTWNHTLPPAPPLPAAASVHPFIPVPPPPYPYQSPGQLRHHLARLLDDVRLLEAVTDELDSLISVESSDTSTPSSASPSIDEKCCQQRNVSSYVRARLEGESAAEIEKMKDSSVECAISLQLSIQTQLEPLLSVLKGTCTWEEAASFARISIRRSNLLRNRKRRKKHRQILAEAIRKEKDRYSQADREADEWRAREIAKMIARRKIEKMKEVAKQKDKEEREKHERELELVLIVEKLQELREIRIQKLKKQGNFFPEEDNRFIERVRAAVEEEERQAAAAADTSSTAAAIASAEEAGKAAYTHMFIHPEANKPDVEDGHGEEPKVNNTNSLDIDSEAPKPDIETKQSGQPKLSTKEPSLDIENSSFSHKSLSKVGATNASVANGALPAEFYHYYYGSSVDMGTLIEVRRLWDTFILPGGSRIPGHWVEPPPPADHVWASCLVTDDGRQYNASH